MTLRLGILGLILSMGAGFPAHTDANSSRLMTPLPEEKLEQSIFLSGKCAHVEIVEWRGSRQDSVLLDAICQEVLDKFPLFIKEKTNFKLSRTELFSQSLSVIPFNSKFRNLNDTEFRFSARSGIEYDEDGAVMPILGYHQRSTSFIYVYNVVKIDGKLNPQFRTVFAHELFHALSFQWGIFQQHSGDKNIKEEEMAQEFTNWLGYGK